jgi:hypothetical protein
MLTKLALYTTLGVLMDALSLDVENVYFWSVLGLFLACDRLSRIEGEQIGLLEGVRTYINMTAEQQENIRRMFFNGKQK